MKFPKKDLVHYGVATCPPGADPISDEIVAHGRWSIVHEKIFKYQGKFYKTQYSVGATESQDESPYDYEGNEIECPEVFPVDKLVTIYEER